MATTPVTGAVTEKAAQAARGAYDTGKFWKNVEA